MKKEINNGKIKISLSESIHGRLSYSITGIKKKHKNISIKKMNSIIQFFGEEELLRLLDYTQDFNELQRIYDERTFEENGLNLDDFITDIGDFGGVLTKEMREMFDFLEPFKENYYLAGGTAISLLLKHRESIDFDIFSNGNNLSLEKIREHILNYKKFKIFNKINGEEGELINSSNIVDIINNNQEIHLKINGVSVDIIDYSRRKEEDEGNYMNTGYFVEGFPLKVPDLLSLGGSKIGAISSRIKNKDFEDIRHIIEKGYSLEELLESYFDIFGNNLIIHGLFDLLSIKELSFDINSGQKNEKIIWINGNSGLDEEKIIEYIQELSRNIIRIMTKDVNKYLRDLNRNNENFSESFSDIKYKLNQQDSFLLENLIKAHKIYKVENSILYKIKKSIFK